MPWRPEMNKEKYKQAILFLLSSRANNPLLGKVKLFKLLYYTDFDHYQEYKTSITGDIYYKWPYGPFPSKAEEILREMASEEMISVATKPIGYYRQYVYTVVDTPKTGIFDESEKKVMEQVVEKWADHTTNGIVAATHGEAPWRAVNMREEIPYALAFYRRVIDEELADEEPSEELVG